MYKVRAPQLGKSCNPRSEKVENLCRKTLKMPLLSRNFEIRHFCCENLDIRFRRKQFWVNTSCLGKVVQPCLKYRNLAAHILAASVFDTWLSAQTQASAYLLWECSTLRWPGNVGNSNAGGLFERGRGHSTDIADPCLLAHIPLVPCPSGGWMMWFHQK